MIDQVHFGDCRASLRTMAAAGLKVQMCVTSPPYFGLRDYGHEGQRGQEATPDEFIAALVEDFRVVRDVLADDGTLWINIGDSYAGSGRGGHIGNSTLEGGKKHQAACAVKRTRDDISNMQRNNAPAAKGKRQIGGPLKEKDLIGIPWMLAFALRADGWYLRQDIIWHKPNPMPESVTDRCTKAHEYLFLLSKSANYYYDHEAVKEAAVCGANPPGNVAPHKGAGDGGKDDLHRTRGGLAKYASKVRESAQKGAFSGKTEAMASTGQNAFRAVTDTRNRRSVWTIATKPYAGAHFAVFPEKLVEPCILAGTSERGHCPLCNARWARVTGRACAACGNLVPTQAKSCDGCGHVNDWKDGRNISTAHVATDWSTPGKGTPRLPGGFTNRTIDAGWAPTCACGCDPVPDVVLDPFMGSGTTGAVAVTNGRHYVGCELNHKYKPLQDQRIAHALAMLNAPIAMKLKRIKNFKPLLGADHQRDLFEDAA